LLPAVCTGIFLAKNFRPFARGSLAEYWDHADAIASTVEMVKAALTGSRPDLRSNEKVELS
jgi:hypothetical protein